jgi:hypothetical protein
MNESSVKIHPFILRCIFGDRGIFVFEDGRHSLARRPNVATEMNEIPQPPLWMALDSWTYTFTCLARPTFFRIASHLVRPRDSAPSPPDILPPETKIESAQSARFNCSKLSLFFSVLQDKLSWDRRW